MKRFDPVPPRREGVKDRDLLLPDAGFQPIELVVWPLIVSAIALIAFEVSGDESAPTENAPTEFSRIDISVVTDNLTGCQYISQARGGLTPRLDADGHNICQEPEQ